MGRAIFDIEPKVRYYTGSKLGNGFIYIFGTEVFSSSIKDIILVEGLFDVYRIEQYLLEEGIFSISILGLGGSNFSIKQIQILRKAYKRCHVLLDNDKSGVKGGRQAWKELALSVPYIEILNLPDGVKDPDELTNEQIEKIIKHVQK